MARFLTGFFSTSTSIARTSAFLILLQTASFGSPVSLAAPTDTSCAAVQLYWHASCPHCLKAHQFLTELQQQAPQVQITFVDIHATEENTAAFLALNNAYGIVHPGVPTFHLCGELMIGFEGASTTGLQLKQMLGLVPHDPGPAAAAQPVISIPGLGQLSVADLGLPLLTLILGLVDGFNPCAMWVLLFLLSILVNVNDRSRMALIAGTFVLASGAVYFLFMAAWLNVFLIIGWSRTLQLVIALIALLIGTIHIKDFFALHSALSLSIPAAVKPGLYQKVRAIVTARHLSSSLIAVVILAIMVNLVELLCTAGLPALYTQILSSHDLARWQYYGYLLLYNAAYLLDDTLMVTVAVITLSRFKLQEHQGRWFKLFSGAVIVAIAVLLLWAPELLHLTV